MRRIWCVLFAVILACSLALVCSAEETEAYTYTASNGVSFTVPANWVEIPSEEGSETLEGQFICISETSVAFCYECTDLYDEKYAEYFEGIDLQEVIPREEFNNSLYNPTYLEEDLGYEEEDISIVTYAGKEYFRIAYEETSTMGDVVVAFPAVRMMRFSNGYRHDFVFLSEEKDACVQDFEMLMESVAYPDELEGSTLSEENESTAETENTPADTATTKRTGQSKFAEKLLVVVMGICIYFLPTMIYRYLIQKKPMSGRKAICVVVIYAIAVIFAMAFFLDSSESGPLAGSIICLCGYINYRILTK